MLYKRYAIFRFHSSMLILICVVLCLIMTPGKGQRPNEEGLKIPLASIFHRDDRQAIAAFRYAQSNFNSISTNPFTLMSYIDKDIDISDSFTLASRMCDRMAAGVFLFYGVKNMMSLDIVQSVTRTFEMPYLSPSTPTWSDKPGPSYEVHLKPEYSYALIEMILHYQWKEIHYVYDSDEGLRNLQHVLNVLNPSDSKKQDDAVEINVLARRIYNIEHAHDELRQLDRMETEQYVNKVIVFDLSTEEAYKHILRQIPEVGMNKEGYHYLIATLDFLNLDMGRYLHGGVNITGFQLLDFESPAVKKFMDIWEHLDLATYPGASDKRLTYEAALAVDAIEVITRALKGMVSKSPKIFQSTFRRKEVYNNNKTKGIPCSKGIPWMHGNDIMREITLLDFEGLTGRIKFDHQAYRNEYKLHVYTVGLDRGPTKIGSWSTRYGFRLHGLTLPNVTIPPLETARPKKVVTIISPPFLMFADPDPKGKPLVGNNRFKGYIKDLSDKIAEKNRYTFEFFLVPDNQYGKFNEKNRTWNGMVGVLTRKEADICIAPLTITYMRERSVDFTKPFMNFGISIMIKKPEVTKPGVFSFMEPLEIRIWIFIVFAYCAVSVGLFLVSRFSPYEWRNAEDCELENKFNILNALWFSMGALMLQGSDYCPRSFSGRVIGTVWWFFVLIIISSYTANLAAFLTIEKMQTPIESADDLSMQTEIKYGTLGSGTTFEFFKNAKVPVYKRMFNFMSMYPDVLVNNVTAGIERVRKSKGKYAFLLESPTNEYENNRDPCDTWKVGPNLNSKGHGIATPKGSTLRDEINLAVLQLMEDGTLVKLKTKWWKDKGVCPDTDSQDSSGKRELSLSNVAGIFYILVGGLAVSVILASIEFICSKSKFMERTSYIKATDTVTTFLTTPTVERENGGFGTEHANNSVNNISNNTGAHSEKEERTYNYSASPPPYIGFEQYSAEVRDNTDL